MLEIRNLHAWYGRSHVLHGIDLEIRRGEIVALIGRNGAGKTTTLKTVMGLIETRSGEARFAGEDILPRAAHARYALGIAYVPEERRIVPGLSVLENLRLGLLASPARRAERTALERVFETFPRLRERLQQRATTLSGGEQQMLALARAMIADPTLLLIDEPTEGIMPILVEEIARLLRGMRTAGKTILLVEQNVELALSLADRAYIIDQGQIVHHASAAALLADVAIQEQYCSV